MSTSARSCTASTRPPARSRSRSSASSPLSSVLVPGIPGFVRLIRGSARFTGPHSLYIEGAETGDDHQIEADHIVIATGSRPRTVPEIEVDGRYVITSGHLTRIQEFPESVVIVGAGVIGCEFASILKPARW